MLSDQYILDQASGITLLGDDELTFTEEHEYVSAVFDIHRTVDRIVRSDELLFEVRTREGLPGPFLHCSPLGRQLLRCLNTSKTTIREAYQKHELSPYFLLFTSKAEEFGITHAELNTNTAERFNNFVSSLRSEARSVSFRRDFANLRRNSAKISRGLLKYLRHLHKRYAKLLVVRVDLGFHKKYRTNLDGQDVSAAFVKSCLEKQLRYMRSKFRHRIGYAWCIEYGLSKSYHVHFLLLFNGHAVRQDATIAKHFGDYWVKTATKGTGTFWNCNARKEQFEKLGIRGIGLINYHDNPQRRNFENSALYLTKIGNYIQLKAPGIGKTFSRGSLKADGKERRGRPRMYADTGCT